MIMNEVKANKYEMCSCGHFGGHSPKAELNSHEPNFEEGHGRCNSCQCDQFTWVGFCDVDGNIKEQLWERI